MPEPPPAPEWAGRAAYLRVPALPAYVAPCRAMVAALAAEIAFTVPEVEEVRLLVSESVSNAVLHAYPEGGGHVELWARAEDGELRVCVRDRGVGIADRASAMEAGTSSKPDRLGLGFAFMTSLADSLTVETSPGAGTAVTWRKRPETPAGRA